MENIDEGKLKAQVTRNRVYKAIGQLLSKDILTEGYHKA